MKSPPLSFIVLLIIVLLAMTFAPASSADMTVPNDTTNQPSASSTTPASASPPAYNPFDSKAARMDAIFAAENARSLDFYGKVVDQFGHPIPGVQAKGSILLVVSPISSANKEVVAETDAGGRFEFVGFHGANFGVLLEKPGYESNGKSNSSPNGRSDRNNPVIFTLWKTQGAQPMVHTQLDSRVPYDGRMAAFDIFSGLKTNTGDLQVTLTRNPVQVHRGGDPFDWVVKIHLVGGGLVETSAAYPYEAPNSGYQPTVDLSMTKNAPDWTQRLTKTYYIRTANGDYGRVNIDLTTDSERPQGTGISIETWLNPTPGSRNLEFDRDKAIKP
jgi:hypothetical protein